VRVDVLRRTGDDGYTLVELLISVTIVGLILSAISGVTVVVLRTAAATDTRFDESNDLLLATAYFAADVMGAQSVAVSAAPRCGTDASAVVEFAGQDFTDDSSLSTTTTVVTYVVRTIAGSPPVRQLRRLACAVPTDSPTYPLTPVTDVPVVRQLSSTAPAVNCGTAQCSAFAVVNLVVREQSGNLTYTLTGRRRVT
jgi:prepilin-type N-terminal cleavage/methylation domain-containing protein